MHRVSGCSPRVAFYVRLSLPGTRFGFVYGSNGSRTWSKKANCLNCKSSWIQGAVLLLSIDFMIARRAEAVLWVLPVCLNVIIFDRWWGFDVYNIWLGGETKFCVLHLKSTSSICAFSWISIFAATRFLVTASPVLRRMREEIGDLKEIVNSNFPLSSQCHFQGLNILW